MTAVAEKTLVREENKMGVMPVGRLVLSMSLPMMASMLVQSLYNIVDSFFVAQLDKNAFTALSLAFPLQNLMIAVGVGTAVGVNANLSRSLGEKKFELANKYAKTGLFLSGVCTLVFMLVAVLFTRLYFNIQTDVKATADYGCTYMFIVTFVCIGLFVQVMTERLLQSTGKTLLSMFTQGLGAILNIILDPLLIFGIGPFPKLGIAGAAIATVMGQCAAAALGIYLNVSRNKEININMRGFKPQKALVGKIYSIGVPSIIMASITSVMTFMLNLILSRFDELTDTLQSALGAYFKLQSFIFMPVFGLNNGTVPIISYNYGAGKRTRVIKTIKLSALFATIIMLIGLALMQLIPSVMLGIFKPDAQLLKYGVPALRIISLSFIFAGMSIVFSSSFQSLGKPLNSMMVSIARQLVILVPTAFLLSLTGKADMVWWSFPIAEIFSFAACCFFMARLNKNVISRIPDNI